MLAMQFLQNRARELHKTLQFVQNQTVNIVKTRLESLRIFEQIYSDRVPTSIFVEIILWELTRVRVRVRIFL